MFQPVSPRAALLLLPIALVSANLSAALLMAHPAALTARDLTLALPVATNWYNFGIALWFCAVLGLSGASVLYVGLLRGQPVKDSWRSITVAAATCLLILLLFPILFSSDIYAYAGYGHMAALNINPYSRNVLNTGDPLFFAIVHQWGNPIPVCVYGPLFVIVAKVITTAANGGGVFWQLMGLRIFACVALLACGPLAYYAFAPLGARVQKVATLGILLNPVTLWSAAEGHNDALMLAIVLGGFIIVRRYSLALGAFVVALSTLVKATGLGAAAILAAFHLTHGSRVARVIGATGLALAVFGLMMLPYVSALPDLLNIISRGVHYAPQFSLQYLLGLICTQITGDRAHGYQFGVALALLAAASIALYGVNRLRQADTSGAAYIAFGLWLATPNAYPWYALWILPTAFLAMHSRMFWVIITASLTIFARYLLDIAMPDNTDLGVIVTLVAIGVPCLLLLRGAPKFASAPLEREAA